MDFLFNQAKSAQPKTDSDKENPAGSSDLLANAKVVAEAAQAQFRNEPEKYDKAKAAGAAADLLDAASGYAKLDESKGVGKYVEQAEGYLRQYNTGGQPAAEHKAPAPDVKESEEKPAAPATAESGEPEKAPAAAEGGYGDLMKMAGGFLKK